jgi:hypothetical protein
VAQSKGPVADLFTGVWLDPPLWEKIDEAEPSDADYIRGYGAPDANVFEVRLGAFAVPNSRASHYLYVRSGVFSGGGAGVPAGAAGLATVGLASGAAGVAVWTYPTPFGVFATAELPLTVAEAASIADYADLRVTFSDNWLAESRVSWVRMVIPDAAASGGGGAIGIDTGSGTPRDLGPPRPCTGHLRAVDDYLRIDLGRSEDFSVGVSGVSAPPGPPSRYYGESKADWEAGGFCAVTGVWRAASKLRTDGQGRRVWVGCGRRL